MSKAKYTLWLRCDFYTLKGVKLARRWFTTRHEAIEWFKLTFPAEYKAGASLHCWMFNSQVGYITTS